MTGKPTEFDFVLNRVTGKDGEEYDQRWLSYNQNSGWVEHLFCTNRILGTCKCEFHSTETITKVTHEEAKDIIFNHPNTEKDDIEEALLMCLLRDPEYPFAEWECEQIQNYCEASYELDINPLPQLRKKWPWVEFTFVFVGTHLFHMGSKPAICVTYYDSGQVFIDQHAAWTEGERKELNGEEEK